MKVAISWNERMGKWEDEFTRFENDFLYLKDPTARAPGEAWWLRGVDGRIASLRFMCPCGCGNIGHVPIKPFDTKGWEWDGNMEQPTLAPSIQKLNACRWHGHLKKGVFERC